MTTHRAIVDGLSAAAASGESTVLATVVRVTGSSYGGVGARMLIRTDGSTVGLVSGGCLESDLAEHARRVHEAGSAEIVRYDTRDDDDAPWGLGLGCNGLIDVLLEPLRPDQAVSMAELLEQALASHTPTVLATPIRIVDNVNYSPVIGAHALLGGAETTTIGDWGDGSVLHEAGDQVSAALAAGRRGLVIDYPAVEVAFEVVMPAVRLVVCGSGPDVAPLVRLATQLGWEVTVAGHRPVTGEHAARFPGARVVECAEALKLGDAVTFTSRTAAVVMSHNYPRDLDYVAALLAAGAAYVGVLGPRARTERMLTDLSARDAPAVQSTERLFAPVGIDLGGDGPEAIALAVIAEVAAVTNNRSAGHLRDRKGSLHASTSATSEARR